MRKILLLPRNGFAVLQAALRQVSLVAFGASLTVTLYCSGDVSAQSQANYVAPAAAASYQGGPVAGTSAQTAANRDTADASYLISSDSTQVKPASFFNNLGAGVPAGNPCVTPGCDVSWYANYEALWLQRNSDKFFSMSRNSFLPDFDYEFGGRYTVGRLFDCVNGWEAVYTGPFDWQRQSSVVGAGDLQSRFFPSGGYTLADIDTFNDANQHVQAWRTELDSFELNRRWWTWDVLSTMIGLRYVDYQERYLFLSDSAQGLGTFQQSVENRMVGAQIGADMLYPVSLRGNFGVRGKAGVYANFDEENVQLQNAGTTLLNAGDNDVEVAGLIEMGVFGNYQIVPSVRLTAGYEFWYLPGVATIPGQSPQLINPSAGTQVDNDKELFLHGGSVGVQVLF